MNIPAFISLLLITRSQGASLNYLQNDSESKHTTLSSESLEEFLWGRKLFQTNPKTVKGRFQLSLRDKPKNDFNTIEFFSRDLVQSSRRTNQKKAEGKHHHRKLIEKQDLLKSKNEIGHVWSRELDQSISHHNDNGNAGLHRKLENKKEDYIWERDLSQSNDSQHKRKLKNKNVRRGLQNQEDSIWTRELNQSNNRRYLKIKDEDGFWTRELNQSSNRRYLKSQDEDSIWTRELNQSNDHRYLKSQDEDSIWTRELNQSHTQKNKNLRRQLQIFSVGTRELSQSNNHELNIQHKNSYLRRELSEKLDKKFWKQVYTSNK